MYIVIVISNHRITKIIHFYNLENAVKVYRNYPKDHRYLFDVYRREIVLLMEDHPL